MIKFNYAKICFDFLKVLPEKQKDVISRRFGFSGKSETLETIGKSYGITRERVRQIEKDGFLRLEPAVKKNQKIFQYFKQYLKKSGGFKKEEIILTDLGGENGPNQVCFLLTLAKDFKRFGQTADFYSFWALNQDSVEKVKEIISFLCAKFGKIGRPLQLKDLSKEAGLKSNILISYLEIAKKIQKNAEGFWGLRDWPEIRPRGVKDKAYLVFKKEKKPLHFAAVASLINKALPQTVHNELIKDPRFVLVGRGLYALKEWGYEDGFVKDIISKTLKEAGKPLTKSEILAKVLKQRMVKENTVLLNLSNKKYFSKISSDSYTIREA